MLRSSRQDLPRSDGLPGSPTSGTIAPASLTPVPLTPVPLTPAETDAILEEVQEDAADLTAALTGPAPAAHRRGWRSLGPGLITGSADDDPSGIGTYSVAGAQFGYALLWLTPVCVPLMYVVQEMCGRIASITGKGLAAVLKEHYPPGILYGAVVLLFAANTINVWADLNAMAASAAMLTGVSWKLCLAMITAATVLLVILVPYRVYVRYLKWLCLSLLAYVVTALLPSVHNDWPEIIHHLFVPDWRRDSAFVMTLVGFLGTTISPYLFFWQASETVEEEVASGEAEEPGGRHVAVTETEIRSVQADTAIGMFFSQAITFFIVICTAATLHSRGLIHIQTAQDAARALLPLGRSAFALFTLGILGTGLLGVPTLAGSAAYALAEAAGWRYGLYRRFRRARAFYVTIGAVVLVGCLLNFVRSIKPVDGLLYAAVLNGLISPPLIVLLLLICNNRSIVGERRNRLVSNILGWITVLLMSAACAAMFWSLAR